MVSNFAIISNREMMSLYTTPGTVPIIVVAIISNFAIIISNNETMSYKTSTLAKLLSPAASTLTILEYPYYYY